jgi:hypothetical protein
MGVATARRLPLTCAQVKDSLMSPWVRYLIAFVRRPGFDWDGRVQMALGPNARSSMMRMSREKACCTPSCWGS